MEYLIWIPAVAWTVLLLGWGGFWRADQVLGAANGQMDWPADWPAVACIIPARDEAATIAEVVRSLTAADYPGPFQVIVVDDGSVDGTGELAAAAGAHVLAAPPLVDGWSGKMAAVRAGLAEADRVMPEAAWMLLTDADIRHAPGTLRALVAQGTAEGQDLVSLMARLDMRGFWGGLLIPAFVFFFQKLYPFAWVNRPGHWVGAAAGGCVLVRRAALSDIGGIEAIRGALIDDCALGRAVKRTGRKIWLGLARDEVVSLRDNRSFRSIWQMVARTAFTQLNHSALLLAGSVLGMVMLYLAPVGLMVAGVALGHPLMAIAGLTGWGLMATAYRPTLRHYGIGAARAWTLPLAGLLYTAMTVGSAVRHWRGRGGQWKGRTYP
ncbi:MAG: glycosyltransferase [Pseudomonadota bacterium]